MKQIELANGKGVVLVDDADYPAVVQYKWHLHEKGYARSSMGSKRVYLHKWLMGAEEGQDVDHRNGNKLDCRRENLRFCTGSQNQANRAAQSNNLSGFKGVSWDKRQRKFAAFIQIDGRGKCLGRFSKAEDAARSYDAAARKYFGEFARTNFP